MSKIFLPPLHPPLPSALYTFTLFMEILAQYTRRVGQATTPPPDFPRGAWCRPSTAECDVEAAAARDGLGDGALCRGGATESDVEAGGRARTRHLTTVRRGGAEESDVEAGGGPVPRLVVVPA